VFAELVRRIEIYEFDIHVTTAAAQAILSHYFSPADGFAVFTYQRKNEDQHDMTVIQIGHIGANTNREALVGEIKRWEAPDDAASRKRLVDFLLDIDEGDCDVNWAISLYGPTISFFQLQHDDDDDPMWQLGPSYAPDRPSQHRFHLRRDADIIHSKLQYIAGEVLARFNSTD
jgi:hypothetical protein